MDKYFPLTKWLHESKCYRVSLSFSKIEEIIGSKLPESAFKHRAWWANTKSHPNALAWMDAGYFSVDCSEVLNKQCVNFLKRYK